MKLSNEEKRTLWMSLYNLSSNLERVDSLTELGKERVCKLMDKLNLELHCKNEVIINTDCYVVDKTNYIEAIELAIEDCINQNNFTNELKITIDFHN